MKSIKLYVLFLFLFNGLYIFSQEKVIDTIALTYLQKAEFNIFGVGVNYEIPVSKDLALDTGIGFTSGVQVLSDEIRYEKKIYNPCFYLKSELKYYYNRKDRVANGFSTTNNAGSYFALQSKFTTRRFLDNQFPLSNTLMYEVHWGIQRTVYKDFLVNLHVGIGRANDFTSGKESNYTAIGIKVSYLFSTEKINFKDVFKW